MAATTPDPVQPNALSPWIKLGLLVVGICLLTVIIPFSPVGAWFSPDRLDWIQTAKAAPLWVLGLYALATVMSVPLTLMSLTAGALLGFPIGLVCTLGGAGAGSAICFLLSRWLSSSWISRLFAGQGRLEQFQQGIQHRGFWYVLAMRLQPIFPFGATNYLFGLTSIALPTYILATLLGMIPGIAAYTYLGQAGLQALVGQSRLQWVGVLTGLTLLALIPILLPKRDPAISPVSASPDGD